MKGLNIPERIKGTLYVCVYSDPSEAMYGHIWFSQKDPTDWGNQIVVGQSEVDIPLSIDGTLDKQVEQLRSAKQKIIDEATEKAGQIDEAIESLLAIEYKDGDQ